MIDNLRCVRYYVHKGGDSMTTTNITNFRKNAFNYVEQTIKYNEPLSISTKDGLGARHEREGHGRVETAAG